MAGAAPADELAILNGSEIVVTVQQSLPDLLVVSFQYGNKLFQGILLDSNKGHLPCGIYPPNGSYPPPPNLSNDKLFAVKQRHSYFCEDSDAKKGLPPQLGKKQSGGSSNKAKVSRPSVRLRPRQVLCSTCQSICNEQNESVGRTKTVLGSTAGRTGQNIYSLTQCGGTTKEGQNTTGSKLEGKGSCLVKSAGTKGAIGVKPVKSTLSEAKVADIENIHLRSCRKTRRSAAAEERETQQTSVPIQGASARVKRKASESASSILVPKIKKLKQSEIDKASSKVTPNKEKFNPLSKGSNSKHINLVCKLGKDTSKTVGNKSHVYDSNARSKLEISCLGIDFKSVTESMPSAELTENNDTLKQKNVEDRKCENKVPKLKLSAVSKKIPKVTISTSNLCSVNQDSLSSRTRSLASNNNSNFPEPTIPKMVLSTSGILTETQDNENKGTLDKKSFTKLGNADHQSKPDANGAKVISSNTKESASFLVPKLTILPFGQKKHVVDVSSTDTKPKNPVKESDDTKPHTTPLLKICFGPDGSGTIMHISPKTIPASKESNENDVENEQQRKATANFAAKAARRALKKAKKEAQKKSIIGGASPSYSLLGGISPRFGGMSPLRLGGLSPARLCGSSPARFGSASPGRFGGASPGRFGGASPGRLGGIGAHSPARSALDLSNKDVLASAVPANGPVTPVKKRKHKLKHKKKHKDDRRHKPSNSESADNETVTVEEGSKSIGSTENALSTNILLKLKTPVTDSNDTNAQAICIWKAETEVKDTANQENGPSLATPLYPSSAASGDSVFRTTSPVTPGRHKLSLSIKRVKNESNEYVACDSNSSEAVSYTTGTSDKEGFASESSESSISSNCGPKLTLKKFKRRLEIFPSRQCLLHSQQGTSATDFSVSKSTCASSPRDGDCASSDELSEVPDFPSVVVTCKNMGDLSLKFRWRDISHCCIRPLYSQALRLQQQLINQDLHAQGSKGLVQDASSSVEQQSLSSSVSVTSMAEDEQKECVVTSTETVERSHWISVGDIVWGKIHGFPWWPAKITGLRVLEDGSTRDNSSSISTDTGSSDPCISTGGGDSSTCGARAHQAHVNWFGSTTASILDPAYLQPFLAFFKQRYIKKKRGPYKGAVRQATIEAEARQKVQQERDQPGEEEKSTWELDPFKLTNPVLTDAIGAMTSLQEETPCDETVLMPPLNSPQLHCNDALQICDKLAPGESSPVPQDLSVRPTKKIKLRRDSVLFESNCNPEESLSSSCSETAVSGYNCSVLYCGDSGTFSRSNPVDVECSPSMIKSIKNEGGLSEISSLAAKNSACIESTFTGSFDCASITAQSRPDKAIGDDKLHAELHSSNLFTSTVDMATISSSVNSSADGNCSTVSHYYFGANVNNSFSIENKQEINISEKTKHGISIEEGNSLYTSSIHAVTNYCEASLKSEQIGICNADEELVKRTNIRDSYRKVCLDTAEDYLLLSAHEQKGVILDDWSSLPVPFGAVPDTSPLGGDGQLIDPISDTFTPGSATTYSGCSPEVENSPGEPRVGSPAPPFIESPEFSGTKSGSHTVSSVAASTVHVTTETYFPTDIIKSSHCVNVATSIEDSKSLDTKVNESTMAHQEENFNLQRKEGTDKEKKNPAVADDLCEGSDATMIDPAISLNIDHVGVFCKSKSTDERPNVPAVPCSRVASKHVVTTVASSCISQRGLLSCALEGIAETGVQSDRLPCVNSEMAEAVVQSNKLPCAQEVLVETGVLTVEKSRCKSDTGNESVVTSNDALLMDDLDHVLASTDTHCSTSDSDADSVDAPHEPFLPSSSGIAAEGAVTPGHLSASPREVDVFS